MARRRKIEQLPEHTKKALYFLDNIKSLIKSRDSKYGGTWYQYGVEGNWSHLKEKLLRMLHQRKNKLPTYASLDTVHDMIVWSLFYLVCIHRPPNFDRERYKLKFTKRQLYGTPNQLSARDMFVLTSKFYNNLFQAYLDRQPITEEMVEELLKSLLMLKLKIITQ